MNKKITSLFLLGVLIVIPCVFVTQARVFKNPLITITIADAYYTDYGRSTSDAENDIVVDFNVELEKELNINSHAKVPNQLKLRCYLFLPSGQKYIYGFNLVTKDSFLSLRLVFYNHATESGWYTVEIHGSYFRTESTVTDSLSFDPPGGTDGTDPPSIMLFRR
ncbi:MAG: hypothetical protein ACFFDS_07740 [Candidatus Thorarchaeota archaeon]